MSEPQIYFGLDGILYADAVRKQKQLIKEAEKQIQEDIRLIKQALEDFDSQLERPAQDEKPPYPTGKGDGPSAVDDVKPENGK